VFTAEAPEGVGAEKHDGTSTAMVALMKYGSGFPFHRLERLEGNLRIPLPASTQWEIVRDGAARSQPAFEELIRQGASGEVLYNDDTSVKILEFLDHERVVEDPKLPGRTGVFTTGIVSTQEGRKIALFFSGRKHAGENLSRCVSQAGRRITAAHPDVRRFVAELATRTRSHPCKLPHSRSQILRRSGRELP